MLRFGKKSFVWLLAIFIGVQFWRPTLNRSSLAMPQALAVIHPPPPSVAQLLEVACYDCHSNKTRYPWYAYIQPSAWWLGTHIREGKAELNFSEFGAYSRNRQAKALTAISDQVNDQSMPLPSYTWIHRDARLSAAQRKLLSDWADNLQEEISDEKN